ncbi:hypothetical protein ACX80E_05475 [Arthrobacter sp. TMN-49]
MRHKVTTRRLGDYGNLDNDHDQRSYGSIGLEEFAGGVMRPGDLKE